MRGQQAANRFEVWIAQALSLHGHRVCHGRENATRTLVEFSPEKNVFSYVWVALICGGMEGTLLLHLAGTIQLESRAHRLASLEI